jgi:hypothetical protein
MSFLKKTVAFVANTGVLVGGITAAVALNQAKLTLAEFAVKEGTKETMKAISHWAEDDS